MLITRMSLWGEFLLIVYICYDLKKITFIGLLSSCLFCLIVLLVSGIIDFHLYCVRCEHVITHSITFFLKSCEFLVCRLRAAMYKRKIRWTSGGESPPNCVFFGVGVTFGVSLRIRRVNATVVHWRLKGMGPFPTVHTCCPGLTQVSSFSPQLFNFFWFVRSSSPTLP